MLAILVLWSCTGEPSSPSGDDSATPGCVAIFEVCDGQDNDCDGAVDEIFDLDGDTYFADDPGCRSLGLTVDCDDNNAAIHPGIADDNCDAVDDDCNGEPDDGADDDKDGWFCDDCDQSDPEVHPTAIEQCDGIDNDCNLVVDDQWDEDGDGTSPCSDPADCNERDPTQSPLAPEVCDGRDNDCDTLVDEEFEQDLDGFSTCEGDCDDTDATVFPSASEICDGKDTDCDGRNDDDNDVDKDGYTICDGDCAEYDVAVHPTAAEVCDDKDDDCNGRTDESPDCYGCTVVKDLWICIDRYSWDESVGVCADLGGELVTNVADTEEATIESYASGTNDYFIGLSDETKEGLWVWPDGTEPTYTDWNTGEPSDSTGAKDYAVVNATGWTADRGNSSGFVCRM